MGAKADCASSEPSAPTLMSVSYAPNTELLKTVLPSKDSYICYVTTVIVTTCCLELVQTRGRWEPGSYGFAAEDGHKWHNYAGDDYSAPLKTGDVVGAGLHLERQEIFFTCVKTLDLMR